ncbi:MAG: hypothetical protein JW384_00745 [Nitrosomonadaceae bacterium]|nr:hypothetical protein [Nitrosomonadaceae bacterium]
MLIINVASSAIRISTPIALAAIGETTSERAGLVNVGLESYMLGGAFAAVITTRFTDNLALGFLCGMVVGVLFALIHGVVCITLGGNQIVSGLGLLLLGVGVTGFLLNNFFSGYNARTEHKMTKISVPILTDIPILGEILFNQDITSYLLYLVIPISTFVLRSTPFGLRVTAAGEIPHALEAGGFSVARTRYQALIVCGALAGLGGAALSLGQLGAFTYNMVAGRGFIAIAAVVFGNWRPIHAVIGTLVFSSVTAFQFQIQALGVGPPPEVMTVIPYLVTVVVLGGFISRNRPPARYGENYVRGERV